MSKTRRKHSATFKAKVALSELKGDKTMSELSLFYTLHPAQIQKWKKQLLEGSKEVFGSSEKERKQYESEVTELHAKIGQLTVERDFLSKAFGR
tara:strand:+ start:3012 stop:3293 length:282 start_codon:yes stop_codon:yes gene_type:complete